MPRVFLPEPLQRLDPSNATEFGELRSLSAVTFNPFDMNAAFEFILQNLDQAEFDPDEDFLIMSGGVVIQSLTLTAILTCYRRAKLLIWSKSFRRLHRKETHSSL